MLLVVKGGVYGKSLLPACEDSEMFIGKKEAGEVFEFSKPKTVRSPRHHKFFFKMLADAHDNLPERFGMMDKEVFRSVVLISAGHYNPAVTVIDGEMIAIRVAKSLAWANMDEEEFRQVRNDVGKALSLYWGMPDDFVLNYM